MLKICALIAIAIIPFVVSSHFYNHEFEFGVSLLKSATKSVPNKTFVVSPHSAYRTLILAYFGAEGSTKKSLSDGLQIRRDKDKKYVADFYDKEREDRTKRFFGSEIFFNTIDQLYMDENISLNPRLVSTIANEFQELDFSDPETLRNDLNDIVGEVTENQLTDFIPKGLITAESKLAIANTVIFKGLWNEKINKKNTKNTTFYGAVPTKVEMMETVAHNEGTYKEVTIVRIPFSIAGTSVFPYTLNLFILVPNKNSTTAIDDFLQNENGISISEAITNFNSGKDHQIFFPKMFLESTFSLRNLTNDMDFKNLFGSESDYSDFTDSPKFQFEDILHKSKFELAEQVTVLTAADATVNVPVAATTTTTTKATSVNTNSKITSTETPDNIAKYYKATVHCDRPFMFMVNDYGTSQVLFTGIYRGPN